MQFGEVRSLTKNGKPRVRGNDPHSFTGVKLDMGMKRKDIFYVYIVKCKNGTYYTGYTNNLENRIKLHNKGDGAKYLKGKAPVKLVYAKEYKYYKNALSAEKNMKKLTRKEKEGLIKNYEHVENN